MPEAHATADCHDCGLRSVELPAPLPTVHDDFDWRTRDFDGFRLHMLEDLAARFPERKRWTPADLEVVLLESLAAALDQLSDMTDRVFAESYLETARHPLSVLRWLEFLGYDALTSDGAELGAGLSADARLEALLRLWLQRPELMHQARERAQSQLLRAERMVTIEDYHVRMEEHPWITQAAALRVWCGSYWVIRITLALVENWTLDQELVPNDPTEPSALTLTHWARAERFHRERGLPLLVWQPGVTPRAVLQSFIDAYRMLGQPVELQNVEAVGINLEVCLRLNPSYFQSEIRRAVLHALSTQPGQFFAPGRLGFGRPFFASDVYQTLLAIDGIDDVAVTQLRRVGWPLVQGAQELAIRASEVVRCDNDPGRPELGSVRLRLHGGRGG